MIKHDTSNIVVTENLAREVIEIPIIPAGPLIGHMSHSFIKQEYIDHLLKTSQSLA